MAIDSPMPLDMLTRLLQEFDSRGGSHNSVWELEIGSALAIYQRLGYENASG